MPVAALNGVASGFTSTWSCQLGAGPVGVDRRDTSGSVSVNPTGAAVPPGSSLWISVPRFVGRTCIASPA